MFSKMILIFATANLEFSNTLGEIRETKKDNVVSQEPMGVGNRMQYDAEGGLTSSS